MLVTCGRRFNIKQEKNSKDGAYKLERDKLVSVSVYSFLSVRLHKQRFRGFHCMYIARWNRLMIDIDRLHFTLEHMCVIQCIRNLYHSCPLRSI